MSAVPVPWHTFGESTYATVDSIRIPSSLIFNAVTLYSPSTEQFSMLIGSLIYLITFSTSVLLL